MKSHTTVIEGMERRLDHLKREKTQNEDKLTNLQYYFMKMNLILPGLSEFLNFFKSSRKERYCNFGVEHVFGHFKSAGISEDNECTELSNRVIGMLYLINCMFLFLLKRL